MPSWAMPCATGHVSVTNDVRLAPACLILPRLCLFYSLRSTMGLPPAPLKDGRKAASSGCQPMAKSNAAKPSSKSRDEKGGSQSGG